MIKLTNVFPVDVAPAIDVISPQRNPPSSALLSMVTSPQLTGIWRDLSSISAVINSVDARIGDAGKSVDIIP